MFGAKTNFHMHDVLNQFVFLCGNHCWLRHKFDGVSGGFISHAVGYHIIVRRLLRFEGKLYDLNYGKIRRTTEINSTVSEQAQPYIFEAKFLQHQFFRFLSVKFWIVNVCNIL